MDEHGTMRQWRGDRCHLREEAILLHDRARARVKQAASRKAEADASSAEARLREREAQFHQAQQAAQQQREEWQAARQAALVWRRTPEQPPQGAELQGHAAGEATDAAEAEEPGTRAEAGPSDGDVATGGPTAGRRGRERGDQLNLRARERARKRSSAAPVSQK